MFFLCYLMLAHWYTVDETTFLEFQPRVVLSDVFPNISGA